MTRFMIFIVLCQGWNHPKPKKNFIFGQKDNGFEKLTPYHYTKLRLTDFLLFHIIKI